MAGAPGTNTPSSAADVFRALLNAGVPQANVVLVAAQSAFETGGWQGGLWNWNLGNITTAGADYVILPGNGLHFAAYDSLQDGANAFVGYLQSHGLLAVAGDLDAYVARLQAIGYAGNADYTAYKAGMASWIQKLGGTVPSSFLWPSGLTSLTASPIVGAAVIVAAGYGAVWLLESGWLERTWRRAASAF